MRCKKNVGRKRVPNPKNPLPSRRQILKTASLAAGAAAFRHWDETGRGGGLPRADDQDHRAVCAGRPDRHHGADPGAKSRPRAWRKCDRGKPPRRRRQYRDRLCRACRSRRLYAAGHLERLCRQSRASTAKIPYDPFKDFAPITELGTTPNTIVVSPKLGINSIAELFARAKAKPDELNYASPGAGTTPHLSAELLKIVGGVEITHVPFSGAAPAIQALLAGTTQMAVAALPAAHCPLSSPAKSRRSPSPASTAGPICRMCRPWSSLATRISSPKPLSSFCARQDAIRHRGETVGKIDRSAEEACGHRAIARQRLSKSSPTARTACASTSRPKCRNGATSSPRPASSRCDLHLPRLRGEVGSLLRSG